MGVKGELVHDKADRTYRRWVKSRLKTQRLIAWLIEDEKGAIVGGGCVWLQPVQPSPTRRGELQPYLLSMYTEPEFRRRGVASMIVGKAIDWSRRQDYSRLTLHASEMGRSVYEKFGFKHTREMRLDLGKPSLRSSRSKPSTSRGS